MIGFFLVFIPPIIITYLLEHVSGSTFSRAKWIALYITNILLLYGTCSVILKLAFQDIVLPSLRYYELSFGDIIKYLIILLIVSVLCFLAERWIIKKFHIVVENREILNNKNLFSVVIALLIIVGFALFWASRWYMEVYGNVGIDAVVFTLKTTQTGVSSDLIYSYLKDGLLPAIICAIIVVVLFLLNIKKRIILCFVDKFRVNIYPFNKTQKLVFSLIIFFGLGLVAFRDVGFIAFLKYNFVQSAIYEDEYVNPDDVDIVFPENKRNVIIIYMESMETAFFSQKEGGAHNDNIIPELYGLAEENINFSHNDSVGGGYSMYGSTWTIGALVAHNTGIPLKLPMDMDYNSYLDDDFLSGATTMMDILDDAGYNQAFMVGSESEFGGRKQFYNKHGVEQVYDIFSAYEDGIVSSDYYVWWGMEDMYLYEYAKQEILEMAKAEEPFAFTMLTVDTHSVGGYICELCGKRYEDGYTNVYACASKQVEDFIKWIEEQDFYEDTTVIILGDHPSMDSEYIEKNVSEDYVRRNYNCFINVPCEVQYTKNREFCSMDMFPTILASMGCEIEGERLGLGTNLFSGKETLIEEMGYEALEEELKKASKYYNDNFLN